MCGAPPALLCCVQGVMERSTGCSIGDDARTSLKMEYKNQESCSTDRLEWEASSHPDHCILTISTVFL